MIFYQQKQSMSIVKEWRDNSSMDLDKRRRWRIIMVLAVVIITSFCVQQYISHKGHGDTIEEKEKW